MKRFFFPWEGASARLLGNNSVVDGSPLLCAPLPVFILAVFLKALKPGAYPKHSFESLNLSLFFRPLPSFPLSLCSSPLLIRRELFFFFSPLEGGGGKKTKRHFSAFEKNKLNIMRGCCQCFSSGGGGVYPPTHTHTFFFFPLAGKWRRGGEGKKK